VTEPLLISKKLVRARPLFDPPIVKRAIGDSFVKLNPPALMKNPVMFVVEVGAALTTVEMVQGSRHRRAASASRFRSRSGCGSRCCSRISPKPWRKAAARRRPTPAQDQDRDHGQAPEGTARSRREVAATACARGDVVLVRAGDIIPATAT
jgi:K+-transporting ATPase ATPase B chain